MYRIRMTENKDFSEKKCFCTLQSFTPGKVIITLEKRTNGKYETIGFISPPEIKEFEIWGRNLDEERNVKASLYFQACSCVMLQNIEKRKEIISFLESIIGNLNTELKEYEKYHVEQEAVASEAGNPEFKFPTWKEYRSFPRSNEIEIRYIPSLTKKSPNLYK